MQPRKHDNAWDVNGSMPRQNEPSRPFDLPESGIGRLLKRHAEISPSSLKLYHEGNIMLSQSKLHTLGHETPGRFPRFFRRVRFLLAFVVPLVGTLPVGAATYHWDASYNGSGEKLWSVQSNWRENSVPVSAFSTDIVLDCWLASCANGNQNITTFLQGVDFKLNGLRIEIGGPNSYFLSGNQLTFGGSNPGIYWSTSRSPISIDNDLNFNVDLSVAAEQTVPSSSLYLNGKLSGSGGLIVTGNPDRLSKVILYSHVGNTYTGGTTISGAELVLSGFGTLGAAGSRLNVIDGGALYLAGSTQTVGRVNAAGAGNGAVGTIAYAYGGGSLHLTSDLYFQSGQLDAYLQGTGNSRLWLGGDSNATILLGGVNTVDYSDHNSTIIGHSTTGAAGTVKLTSPFALGPAAVGANAITAELHVGTINANGQAGVTVGNLRLASGASSRLVNTNTSRTARFKGKVQVDLADTVFGGDGNMTFSNVISGAGSIHKKGAGRIVFDVANTYAFGTTISAGTLQIGGSGTVGAPGSRLSLAGGTLNLGGSTQTVGRVNASGAGNGAVGTIINGSLILNDSLFFQSGTLAPGLNGTGNSRLWLGGDSNATIILGGTNTIDFSDHSSTIIGHPTTGAAGTVRLTNPAALGPAAVGGNTITAQLFSGTIDANGQAGITLGNLLLVNGAGSKLVNSDTGAAASFSGKLNIVAAGTEIGGAGDMTFNNVISGAGGFKKTGNGTITLSAANTYTGATEIAGGALVLTSTGKLSTVANVTVNAGAIMQLNPGFNSEAAGINVLGRLHGSGSLIAPVTIQSGGHLAPGLPALVGTLNLGALQLNAGSVLEFEGDGSGFDRINIIRNNGLILAGLAEIKLTDLGALAAGDYVLIDYNGSVLGNFSDLQLSSARFGAFDVSLINNTASTSIDLRVTAAVPEPSTYALMGLGLLAVVGVVRRRAYQG